MALAVIDGNDGTGGDSANCGALITMAAGRAGMACRRSAAY
jgi:hypothetical protein